MRHIPSGFRSHATTALPFVASPSTAASGTEQAPANRQHWGTAASVVVELHVRGYHLTGSVSPSIFPSFSWVSCSSLEIQIGLLASEIFLLFFSLLPSDSLAVSSSEPMSRPFPILLRPGSCLVVFFGLLRSDSLAVLSSEPMFQPSLLLRRPGLSLVFFGLLRSDSLAISPSESEMQLAHGSPL